MTPTLPPERVPTLTEVVEAGPEPTGLPAAAAASPALETAGTSGAGTSEPDASAASEAEIARRVTAQLQAHVDRVLEHRVRAALEPVLQPLVARIVEETRRELASTLRDGLARALARETSRHRDAADPR